MLPRRLPEGDRALRRAGVLPFGMHLGLSDIVRTLADRDGRVRGERGHAPQ